MSKPEIPSRGVTPVVLRYGLAVLFVAISTSLTALAEPYNQFRSALFFPAILLIAWYSGTGPALLAVLLSTLSLDLFFLYPKSQVAFLRDAPYLFTFVLTALLISSWSLARRRTEEQLRIEIAERKRIVAERTQQASLLNLTHDSIFVRDMDFVITYWNLGAQELYGWTAEDAIGKQSHQLLQTVYPTPLDDVRAELMRTGRWEGELERTKADGTHVIVASRWSLRRDERERPVAILETNNDITERKRREEEIRKLNEDLEKRTAELEAINKELEAFAYSISHDLRAPLRHMAGYAELLQKNAFSLLDEKSRRYMTMILESAKRMGDLIDDLLAFSRIGRAETRMTTVSLEQLAKEALSEIQQETNGRNIAWRIGALPNVYGDRSMLRLALINLVSNAVKFTRKRSQAEIEIGCTDGKQDEIVVFIRDNGVGFDMKYVNKLFGVFQRLHRAEEFEGTGIGLATVQRIIHRHGGRIWAEGLVDRGATFYFSVPKS